MMLVLVKQFELDVETNDGSLPSFFLLGLNKKTMPWQRIRRLELLILELAAALDLHPFSS